VIDVLAIDGPAGAGKSTVSRIVAERLGFAYLDTGAMYRAVTLRVMRCGINLDDAPSIATCARQMKLEMKEKEGRMRVWLDGEDVTDDIRSPEVTRLIYRVDENPEVRAHLVGLQRAFGESQPTVAEGRDMGTVVFPDAKCKVYLDASLDVRAKRRMADLHKKGIEVDWESVRREISERDEKNMKRATAPLRPAPDASYVDTSEMSIDDVVETILGLARNAGLPARA